MVETAGVVLGGVVLGAAGSGHCAAMCGPLVALANPRTDATHGTRALAMHAALYHGGRIATYAALGGVIGFTGSALVSAGLGRGLALAAAVAVLAQAVLAWHAFRGGAHGVIGGIVTRAIGRAGAWMRRHRVAGPAVFGALTGLLPCGLVYAALTASAGFGSPLEGALFMAAFGIGTTPLLATVGLSAGTLERHVPRRLKRLAPLALAAVAVLLIVRASGGHMNHGGHAPASDPAPAAMAGHHHGG